MIDGLRCIHKSVENKRMREKMCPYLLRSFQLIESINRNVFKCDSFNQSYQLTPMHTSFLQKSKSIIIIDLKAYRMHLRCREILFKFYHVKRSYLKFLFIQTVQSCPTLDVNSSKLFAKCLYLLLSDFNDENKC